MRAGKAGPSSAHSCGLRERHRLWCTGTEPDLGAVGVTECKLGPGDPKDVLLLRRTQVPSVAACSTCATFGCDFRLNGLLLGDRSGLFVFVFVRGRRRRSRVQRRARGLGFTAVLGILRQLRHHHAANTGRFPPVSISLLHEMEAPAPASALAPAGIDDRLSHVLAEAYSGQNGVSSRARVTLVKTIPPIRLE